MESLQKQDLKTTEAIEQLQRVIGYVTNATPSNEPKIIEKLHYLSNFLKMEFAETSIDFFMHI